MSALIIVDVQNDFLPGGALAIAEGDTIIPRINALLTLPFSTIVASMDWHPANHSSFAINQGKLVGEEVMLDNILQILWPVHCVEGTYGAEFSSLLDKSHFEKIFFKGVNPAIDSYSCFFDNGHLQASGIEEYLREKGITKLFLAGLATDYCVKYSVLDALELGFDPYIVTDACRGVMEDGTSCLEELEQAGAHLITSKFLLEHPSQIAQDVFSG